MDQLQRGGGRRFGQRVDLCARLKQVLDNYPEDALMKEMLQNADDAGAGTFCVVLDRRLHQRATTVCEGTAAFQGPAIVTYNDAVFSDDDLDSIQNVGGSHKVKEDGRSKTGRFGIGFNACYHVTDVPALLTRHFLCLFDPHQLHVPDPADTGWIGDWKEDSSLIDRYQDQFAPFVGFFGCHFPAEFGGTLFRLPLRTVEQAATSRISRQPYTMEAAQALLEQFIQSLDEVALFLTHVHTIKVSTWAEAAPMPVELCVLNVKDRSTGIRPIRHQLHELIASARAGDHAGLRSIGIQDVSE